ncbi:NIPSNAP family protein [Micromonospora mirobrigensis]|uniref:NIPSNAP protein n=1 Tax=Micromonospora mirobrigensis TaxID=262898 RepID=A0A1C4Y8M7_9ACTN|nr:NIPSNAP family protein [Micromonospora mirobrigensis]SCF17078.1 NIPSNAP protein [Micromonospora mirobrigensis]
MQPSDFASCAVVEMRRYALRPGHFDDLQRVFQPWLVASQEQAGMRLGGQFRDREDPDRFVWFRGFAGMDQRREALESFYYGPVWQAHRDAANATMLDSDDVLLLRPTEPAHHPAAPATPGLPGPTASPTWAVAHVWALPADAGLEAWLTTSGHAVLQRAFGVPVAMWRTEPAENTFPRLPVRDGRFVVSLAMFEDGERWGLAADRLESEPEWRRITARLSEAGVTSEVNHLQPTATSGHPMPAVAGVVEG